MQAISTYPVSIGHFLRADANTIHGWIMARRLQMTWFCVVAIIVGAGGYGAVLGAWREPLQALYTGIKLPLVILLTTCGNGLLNGILAPLLGLNVSFRQSFAIVLMTFAIAALILGALSPVALFLVWNTPALTASTRPASAEYQILQLSLAVFIAYAGIMGNLHIMPLLREYTGSVRVARRVLLAWLAGNLLLGSKICWVLRPFIWDPVRPVEFIGPEYFCGSFFETVFQAAWHLIFR
ncbi:MAG TPA: hypothetical protein VGE41_10925 [Verrucomicrobiae bacterium]|jgi:hypothetical protein